MLKKTSHNTYDFYIVGFSCDTWKQTADAADYQIYANPFLRGRDKRVDDFPILKGVYFQPYSSSAAFFRFFLDKFYYFTF